MMVSQLWFWRFETESDDGQIIVYTIAQRQRTNTHEQHSSFSSVSAGDIATTNRDSRRA
jgi:hypothetical protein